MAVMKHVGKFGEKPCVVLFREVPNEPENCLVVQTSNLSDSQHDDLMNVLQSAEAQESNNISEVLHRRQFGDGSNMLSSLHYGKKIQKVSVSLVSLTPTPSSSIPLSEVNAEIRKIEGGYTPPKTSDVHLNEDVAAPLTQTSSESPASEDDIARNLMKQAELLEQDAKSLLKDAESKRAEAVKLDPSLEQKAKRGRPKKETA